MTRFIVAVDGPAGSGKSTVSRAVARRLGVAHLDTGSYYRAATLAAFRQGVDLSDGTAVLLAVRNVEMEPVDGVMTVDGEVVEEAIRGDAVTGSVSVVAAHPEVRAEMVSLQRLWVARHGGQAVVEGRDIGTVVFPDADLKVFLVADPIERARRRALERSEQVSDHLAAIERRDAFDSSRQASPLLAADDAAVIDTTHMTIDEVVEAVLELARERTNDRPAEESPG